MATKYQDYRRDALRFAWIQQFMREPHRTADYLMLPNNTRLQMRKLDDGKITIELIDDTLPAF